MNSRRNLHKSGPCLITMSYNYDILINIFKKISIKIKQRRALNAVVRFRGTLRSIVNFITYPCYADGAGAGINLHALVN